MLEDAGTKTLRYLLGARDQGRLYQDPRSHYYRTTYRLKLFRNQSIFRPRQLRRSEVPGDGPASRGIRLRLPTSAGCRRSILCWANQQRDQFGTRISRQKLRICFEQKSDTVRYYRSCERKVSLSNTTSILGGVPTLTRGSRGTGWTTKLSRDSGFATTCVSACASMRGCGSSSKRRKRRGMGSAGGVLRSES
jgi:hypothetical protein